MNFAPIVDAYVNDKTATAQSVADMFEGVTPDMVRALVKAAGHKLRRGSILNLTKEAREVGIRRRQVRAAYRRIDDALGVLSIPEIASYLQKKMDLGEGDGS